jgi:hypothetical protein
MLLNFFFGIYLASLLMYNLEVIKIMYLSSHKLHFKKSLWPAKLSNYI